MEPLLEHFMPSLMALKKALPGDKPEVLESHFVLLCAFRKSLKGNLKLFKKESESEKDKHC